MIYKAGPTKSMYSFADRCCNLCHVWVTIMSIENADDLYLIEPTIEHSIANQI